MTTIGNQAFSSCTSLQEIIFRGHVPETIGTYAFSGAKSPVIYYPSGDDTWTEEKKTEISKGATVTWQMWNTGTEGEEAGFQYLIENEEAGIIGYSAPDGQTVTDIVVPETLGGYPVTAIGYKVFADNNDFVSISLPASLKNVEAYFVYNCPNLKTVTVAADNQYFCVENGILYNTDKTRLLFMGQGALSDAADDYVLSIPETVQEIAEGAFYNCTNLKQILLPPSLTTVGKKAFSNCTQLTYIDLPVSVTEIGDYAFEDCIDLEYFTAGPDVTNIGLNILKNVSSKIPTRYHLADYYAVSGSAMATYLKGYYGTLGRLQVGTVLGDYVLGIKVVATTDKKGVGDYYISNTGLNSSNTWYTYSLKFTRELSAQETKIQIVSAEGGKVLGEQRLVIEGTVGEVKSLPGNVLSLPFETKFYLQIPEGSIKDGETSLGEWSNSDVWVRSTITDQWSMANFASEVSEDVFTWMLGEKKGKKLAKDETFDGTGGLCWGMAAALLLVREGKLPVSSFIKDSKTVSDVYDIGEGDKDKLKDYKNSDLSCNIQELFEILFVYQNTLYSKKSDGKTVAESIKNMIDGSGTPGMVTFRYTYTYKDKDNKEKTKDGAHVVLPVSYIQKGDMLQVYVYDCNISGYNGNVLNIDLFTNEWSYEQGPMGEISSEDGARIYFDKIDLDEAYETVRAYKLGLKNPVAEKVKDKGLLTIQDFTDAIVETIEKIVGSTKSASINGDTVTGDLLTPILAASGADASESSSGSGEKMYWVEEDSDLTISDFPANTQISLIKEVGSVSVKTDKQAKVVLKAANASGEVTGADITADKGTAFSVEMEILDENDTENVLKIDGTAAENGTVEVKESDSGIALKGADSATVTIEKDGTEYTETYKEIGKYQEVIATVEKNADTGKTEVVMKQDSDGDGKPDTRVPTAAEIIPAPTASPVPTAVPAEKSHTWSDYSIIKNATVLEEGVKERTCSTCGQKDTVTIPKEKATISVNVKSLPLQVKKSTTAVKVTYGTGDKIVSWKSNKPKVASVSSKGKITAKKTGKAVITVKLKSGKSAKITINVQKGKVTTSKLKLDKTKLTLKKKQTYQLKTAVTPLTSSQKVVYKSSNSKVVTVNAKGKITAKKKGTAYVTVTSGKKKVKCKVTVR